MVIIHIFDYNIKNHPSKTKLEYTLHETIVCTFIYAFPNIYIITALQRMNKNCGIYRKRQKGVSV